MNFKLTILLKIFILLFLSHSSIVSQSDLDSVSVAVIDPETLTQNSKEIRSETNDLLTLENEFIKLLVNNQNEDQGRFSIETTQGSPESSDDDNQLLIFGRPIPWTSYTTILIDNKPYIFGGIDKKVSKRSGLKQNFGTVISQKITNTGIETKCNFGDIDVIQKLSLLRNPSTQVKDSSLISYKIINNGTASHNVGIRIMLDTKLGTNDGAPFRIGEDAIISEIQYTEKSILDYWQTFDNLSSPNIIAQGTLLFPEKKVFPPNKIALVNWGTLVDHPWDFPYKKGRSFIRSGELEKDTALALYWTPKILQASETQDYNTIYGLGGLTMAAGELTIGITAPAEVALSSKTEFLIVAYILNSGGFDSKNTTVHFELPKGFEIKNKKSSINLGTLISGQTKQVPIKVKLKNAKVGKNTLKVRVSSDTLDDNEINRDITLIGEPKLISKIKTTSYDDLYNNAYTNIFFTVTNPNSIPIINIDSSISLSSNLKLPNFESRLKSIPRLNPNKSYTLHWKVKKEILNIAHPFSIIINSDTTKAQKQPHTLIAPSLKRDILLNSSKNSLEQGDYFYISINADNFPLSPKDNLTLHYNPNDIEYIRLSPNSTMIKNLSNWSINATRSSISISDLSSKELTGKNLFKLHFRAKKTSNTRLDLHLNNTFKNELNLNIN